MRKALLPMTFAASLILCDHAANAVTVDVKGVREAATASLRSQVQYAERRTRYGVVKCYRSFVVGRYRCHHYY